jgi:hypothetical protein
MVPPYADGFCLLDGGLCGLMLRAIRAEWVNRMHSSVSKPGFIRLDDSSWQVGND